MMTWRRDVELASATASRGGFVVDGHVVTWRLRGSLLSLFSLSLFVHLEVLATCRLSSGYRVGFTSVTLGSAVGRGQSRPHDGYTSATLEALATYRLHRAGSAAAAELRALAGGARCIRWQGSMLSVMSSYCAMHA